MCSAITKSAENEIIYSSNEQFPTFPSAIWERGNYQSKSASPSRLVGAKTSFVTTKITFWKEPDESYLGYLNNYLDHWTQGENLMDLKEQLRDLFRMFSAEEVPGIHREEEMEVA